jgi:hypothetical protein
VDSNCLLEMQRELTSDNRHLMNGSSLCSDAEKSDGSRSEQMNLGSTKGPEQ